MFGAADGGPAAGAGGMAGTGCDCDAAFGADVFGIPDGAFPTSAGLLGVADAPGEEAGVEADAEDDVLSGGVPDGGAVATVVGELSGVAGGETSFGDSAGGAGAVLILDDSVAAVDDFAPSPASMR